MRGVSPAASGCARRWTARLRHGVLWLGVPIVLAAGV